MWGSLKTREKQKSCMEGGVWYVIRQQDVEIQADSIGATPGWRGLKIIWSKIVFNIKMFEHHFKSKQALTNISYWGRGWGYTPFPSANMPGTQQPPCTHLTWSMHTGCCQDVVSSCHTQCCARNQTVTAKDRSYLRHCLTQLSLKNWYCYFQTWDLSIQWNSHINRHK